MSALSFPFDLSAFRSFAVVHVTDPRELDWDSRVTRRLPERSRGLNYSLQDRALLNSRFDAPITTLMNRRLGEIGMSMVQERFASVACFGAEPSDIFYFTTVFDGWTTINRDGEETTAIGANGLAFRGSPGLRFFSSDKTLRQNLVLDAASLERNLEAMLGNRLHRKLVFKPTVDWSRGLAAGLRGHLDLLLQDLRREDGIAENPIAMASLTDVIIRLVLLGLPHNYSDWLAGGASAAVPAFVRRAEDFMHAQAGSPIRMADIAAAAGCSVRTLTTVFRRFRDTTPLAALHTIRLDKVRADLRDGRANGSVASVARAYGFTHAGRFTVAYRRRFGEAPTSRR